VNDDIVEQHLEHYHQLARELRESYNIDQAALALEPLINIAYADQIAYLKALGRENSSDAADIAQAMYNIAPDKEARKEARRTLLRLEAQGIYPRWNITVEGLVVPSDTESRPGDLPAGQSTTSKDRALVSLDSLLQDLEDFFDSLPGTPTLQPVTALLESWGEGDPDEAYNALSPRSPLRAGLDADTWIERRAQWLEAADTGLVKIAYIGEKDKLAPDSVVVEATWSLPIGNLTAENPPTDLPTATCVFKETGRHWFWTSYVVVEEDGQWHITDMTDEGAMALQLPIEDIEQILREKAAKASQNLALLEDEEDEDFEDFDEDEFEDEEDVEDEEDFEEFDEDEEDEDEDEEDSLNFLEEMEEAIREATQALHYHDAFIHRAPHDGSAVYQSAVEFAQIIQDTERAAAYFQQLAQNIPEYRGKALCGLAMTYEQLLQEYLANDPEDPESELQHYNTLIEETLRQASTISLTTQSYILFADVLIRQNKNLDEAEALLKKALPTALDDEDIVSIEERLAELAQNRDQQEEALQHYQNITSLDAEFPPQIWFKIGSLQHQLGAIDEAMVNLRRSVKEEPDIIEAYIELSAIYSEQKLFNRARDILRKALDKSPDSVDLLASLSLVYAQSGDLQSAQRYLHQAEAIDEQNSFVAIARTTLQTQKEQKLSAPPARPKDRPQPKHRSHKHKKK
jgi:tetratricopeptide (TPR) repeat protein